MVSLISQHLVKYMHNGKTIGLYYLLIPFHLTKDGGDCNHDLENTIEAGDLKKFKNWDLFW